ncbi:ion transporter [Sphingosinicella terrae]|uniref:ion transporter n=1 Tax=Sphingosinicella terrae TaxID=2172047 RepID=UPI000E0DD609|nr:ion transporter [Sphingosinicella terrae]
MRRPHPERHESELARLEGDGASSLRRSVHLALDPSAGLTWTSLFLILAIVAATAAAVAETEPLLSAGNEARFRAAEIGFGLVFTIEYALRFWAAPEGGRSRLAFVRSPAAIIDLVAIIVTVLPFIGANAMLLRLVRVARLLRIAKLGRFSRAMRVMERALRARASHLAVTILVFFVFLLFGASIIYLIEGEGQPDKFGSIPRAMWWTAVTMTTVGYGDVVPITPLGRLVAALISIGGIMTIAIPTGIMAAAFSDLLKEEEALEAAAASQAEAE